MNVYVSAAPGPVPKTSAPENVRYSVRTRLLHSTNWSSTLKLSAKSHGFHIYNLDFDDYFLNEILFFLDA